MAACTACSHQFLPQAEHLRGGPHHFGFGDVVLMLISLTVAVTGWLLAHRVYVQEPSLEAQWIQRWHGYYTLLLNKYYVDEIYAKYIVRPLYTLSESGLWRVFDVGVIDRLVNVVGRVMSLNGQFLSYLQTGYVRTYALTLVGGAVHHAPRVAVGARARGRKDNLAWLFHCSALSCSCPCSGLWCWPAFPVSTPMPCAGVALVVMLVTFGMSLALYPLFDPALPGMQLSERVAWISSVGIFYHIGIDGISLPLVLLTTFLSPIAFLGAWHSITTKVKEFAMFMLLLETAMLGAFLALDLFLFFIFWEAMLIPMYFIIGIWGGENRLYATVKFILYTMAGSALMLVAILALYVFNQQFSGQLSFDLLDLYRVPLSLRQQKWLFLAFFLSFAIKVPLFPFHTWLPDAHVEAPTPGSVILAGVLLKMGGYGLLRFCLPLFPDAVAAYAPTIAVLAIIGIIYGALVAMVQPDVKKLVAYSSVSHLGFVVLGIFSRQTAGIEGSVLQMVNHGLSTGGAVFAGGDDL